MFQVLSGGINCITEKINFILFSLFFVFDEKKQLNLSYQMRILFSVYGFDIY